MRERLRHQWQELKELGLRGTLFRLRWELEARVEPRLAELSRHRRPMTADVSLARPYPRLFEDSATMERVAGPWLSTESRAELITQVDALEAGRIWGFGHGWLDFGQAFDWHRHPISGSRWPADIHWRRVLRLQRELGDVKFTWEAARFPQLYHLARAAVFVPKERMRCFDLTRVQILSFIEQNPRPWGVHWASGQETAFRLMAWAFALHVFDELREGEEGARIASAMVDGAEHIERHFDYARLAVTNNHLLSEALGLLLVGILVPQARRASQWRRMGQEVLEEQAERQVYPDGGYIQQSHNYHRVALTDFLWACAALKASDGHVPEAVQAALARSADFLWAHQNGDNGRLPNYGANDGAQPSPLSSTAYPDFRPTLQAAALQANGQRLYAPGPWDEEALWYVGAATLGKAPVRSSRRQSKSFSTSGHHVLRGDDVTSFAGFRCGTLRDRFSQIDMLHLDVCWRGCNVLTDGGSYLYNGPPEWHTHFMSTAAHNTVGVDDRDQMKHHRQFKLLYPTQATLLHWERGESTTQAVGEHYGYMLHAGRCVHRRAVLAFDAGLWVVLDTVTGESEHKLRLHWLAGDYPHQHHSERGELELETPAGGFKIGIFDERGEPLRTSCHRGSEAPRAGWLSRFYGDKRPVPALIHEAHTALPWRALTCAGPGDWTVSVEGGLWSLSSPALSTEFRLDDEGAIALEDLQTTP